MKEPKFFCDNCGTEVSRNLNACPGCGRFFSSVRCPKCGFSGEENLFASGCPSCGYSAPPVRNSRHQYQNNNKATRSPVGPLPLWVWVFVAAAVLAVLVSLLMLIIR